VAQGQGAWVLDVDQCAFSKGDGGEEEERSLTALAAGLAAGGGAPVVEGVGRNCGEVFLLFLLVEGRQACEEGLGFGVEA
jgi:hypothetical protein